VTLSTHIDVVPRLRKIGATPLRLFTAWTETTLRFNLHRCNLTQETFSRRMADSFWNILYMFLRVWCNFSVIDMFGRICRLTHYLFKTVKVVRPSTAQTFQWIFSPSQFNPFLFYFTLYLLYSLTCNRLTAHSTELYTECDLVLPLSRCSIFFSLKVIQYLLKSSSSSFFSCYLSCSNVS
jgi:hypothetical protein